MRRAIQLARQSDPQSVSPNPHVGAVLAYEEKDGSTRIIGEGYHKKRGQGHAEVECLKSVKPEDRELVPQSTMYVTLEPCAHIGRTPSCAKMIVEKGIPRVIIGTTDPNPLVAGKGIDILRSNNVKVTVGVLESECREVAKVFMTNQERHRPFITLKWAQSRNGYMDKKREGGAPMIFSTPFTSGLVHRERSRHSAILVGIKTLVLDQAKLSNRLWTGPSPQPFVIDPDAKSLNILENYRDAERWTVVTTQTSIDPNKYKCKILQVRDKSTILDELISYLNDSEITSLLVEGGSYTLLSFIEVGLWDEARIEKAPFDILEEGISVPLLKSAKLIDSFITDDRIIEYYRHER
ncbi:bifunctional diaminohydroxyphosphoribosylaminopyrimidine deaminase/5-amino-6-(5-phosphoribosylamino)uracil reductase RibD [Porphyromonas sp.]|uniref:bifunctional diaminohydroxyphosphoribosylaminopyrimidine deaminase/5-amino-6-(5-phosphoribosylamino)uracil reductase RibD n=1 Tax=Porphyromonas sp. TaxID=1924944 RepID=UPI0026DC4F74|nr:bifunctional diaminohydroxyphosphoribosylaminopyrimidine deaminase/5-amino-6-(5-phosphoribosylamino)uracil reductase RibD [Porphyromonas sp.]MDO4695678.1 bifunctional diaminohydroxyphosphoribosylaminopyrimidine deaminase/5-amino-6-(5-phosphoribosylamino)uracil reductase RibD [Porphyromonas sp.]MDO4771498.1 bifunctional diaminohydroxyphosphoribosylaminopyrimidine deaminase/5-amino-6-(5-phosphoribosylamino)uracil reductase RibD [Porphyromonas sp.]